MKSAVINLKMNREQRTGCPRKVVNHMTENDRYSFESFSADVSGFDGRFTDFVNNKYDDGWKYKDCQYRDEGEKRQAYCLFKKHY